MTKSANSVIDATHFRAQTKVGQDLAREYFNRYAKDLRGDAKNLSMMKFLLVCFQENKY